MLYVATENNTVYAIDADSPFTICQSVSLNNTGTNADTATSITALPQSSGGPCITQTGSMQYGTVGVTGTLVIDPNHNMLFVVSAHQGGTTQSPTYTQRLTAVDITSLNKVATLDLPTAVNAAKPSGYPTFYALNESQRSGLALTKIGTTGANIYVAWATFCDSNISSGGSFGLVSEFDFSYSASQFGSNTESFYAQGTNTNLSTPTGNPAGVWMSGGAPAVDAGGNVYVAVGNGNFQGVNTPLNFGNSIVKLGGSTFGEEDFYTPNVWSVLNSGTNNLLDASCGGTCTVALSSGDWDLGSGGVVLLTTSSATQYGELVAAGKEGMFYVTFYCSSSTCPNPLTTPWNQLMGGIDGGGYNTNTKSVYSSIACTQAGALAPSNGSVAQCFYGVPVGTGESGERATPAFWTGTTPYLYTVGTTDVLKGRSFSTTTGVFADPATGTGNPPSGSTFSYPGATPSISSNGSDFNSAVLWVLDTSAWKDASNNRAVLTAYAAKPSGSSLTQLWTSTTTGPGAVKFMVPTIANGKVYVAGQVVGNVKGCGAAAGCGGLLTIYHQ